MKMMQAIIDIGSNSIRLAVYKVEESNKISLLMNKKDVAGLAAYVKKDSMTPEGIDKACAVLLDFKQLLDNLNIVDVIAFATAALRNVTNSEAAVKAIEARTGLTIQVLSGSEEASLAFAGATHEIQGKSGMLIDLGGASTEIVLYKDSLLEQAVSLPIGSLNACKLYVNELLPNKNERKAIKDAVLAELEKYSEIKSIKQANVCGVGGTIRAASKINNYLFNLPSDSKEIKVPNIKKMIKLLENDEVDDLIATDTLQILLRTVPDRIETILPGMIILHTLTKYFKSEIVTVSYSGVREGYLRQYVLPELQKEKQLSDAIAVVDSKAKGVAASAASRQSAARLAAKRARKIAVIDKTEVADHEESQNI